MTSGPAPKGHCEQQSHRCGARIALIAAAIVCAILLGACGSSSTTSSTSAPPTLTTYTAQPKGELKSVTWDLPLGEPVPLDPTKDWNPSENIVLAQMCDSLFRINPAMKIEPDLAQSVTHPTPLTWVYDIRPGVKFWDGTSLTAKDVDSLRRQIEPSVASVYLEPVGALIAKISQTGPMQVTLTTHRPSGLVNEMMASGMGVVTEERFTKSAGANYGTAKAGVMCSGPFEFGSWTPGSQIVLKRNPHYWDAALEPKIASITFKWVTDSSTLTDALLKGEIDGTYEAPASSVSELRASSSGHLYVGPATDLAGMVAIGGNTTQTTQLLGALSLAVDRKALAKIAYSGAATPTYSTSVFPIRYPEATAVYQAYNAELEREYGGARATNLERAKQLVASAGKPSKPLSLVYTAGITTESIVATAIVAEAESVGIPMQAVPLQPSEITDIYLSPAARKKYDILLSFQLWTDLTDPLEAMAVNATPGPTNLSQWSLPAGAMKQYEEADATTEPNKRAELTVDADRAMVKSSRYIPLLYTPERMYLDNSVTGAASSWPYAFHFPWAAQLGASG